MKKVKFVLVTLWIAFVSAISPVWIGLIYVDITGHGKGYDYNLGSEVDVWVFFGIIELLLWIFALIPLLVYLCKKLSQYKKYYMIIPIVGFVVFFCIGVLFIGWYDFLSFFGYGYYS